VRIVGIGTLNDPEVETLVLVDRKQLGKDAMENIDEQVLHAGQAWPQGQRHVQAHRKGRI
jgi:hypothetical protein